MFLFKEEQIRTVPIRTYVSDKYVTKSFGRLNDRKLGELVGIKFLRMNTVEASLYLDRPRIESNANESKYDKDRKQI